MSKEICAKRLELRQWSKDVLIPKILEWVRHASDCEECMALFIEVANKLGITLASTSDEAIEETIRNIAAGFGPPPGTPPTV